MMDKCSDEDVVVSVQAVGKFYSLYDSPHHRLLQALFRGKRMYGKTFWSLKDVSFNIFRGEVVGVIGPNGSGKSTLLQLICGVLAPSEGAIRIKGKVAAILELGAGFNHELTGHENLYLNAAILGLSEEETSRRYNDILDFSGIGDFIHQPVKTYSSGMVVRLAFAISSFVDADILIVDEALAVGDVLFQARCLDRMERLMMNGVTVVLVTHDMQMIRRYTSRVLYLRSGRVVFDGDPEEATERYLSDSQRLSVQERLLRSDTSLVSFEDHRGRVVDVKISVNGKDSNVVSQGGECHVDVDVEIGSEIKNPRVQLTVRDLRGYNVFGYNNLFGGVCLINRQERRVRLRFSFLARLQVGVYTIKIRLDDHISDDSNDLIDSRAGALDFHVVASARTFDAVVDLSGGCKLLT